MPYRLILADDHPLLLDGLANLFEAEADFELLARCGDGDEAWRVIRRDKPDVAVLDLRMPGRSGVEILREIVREKLPTRVVLLTAEVSDEETLEAVRLGVGGVVLKGTSARQIVQCIRTVAGGGQVVEESLIRGALDRMMQRESGAAEARKLLTPREIEIVKLVANGLRNKEIAGLLSISESTVKIHVHSIYQKLGVSGRVELTNYAREKSLI